MQLISLSISGFKSFAIETAIQFAPGVTGVVGPNGCGKSNVVDALRWVLGEQRSSILRGERMENVIFNGTAKRKPLNMAEVRVKFDNDSSRINLPYSQIEIARKLHRDGTSEYLINGNVCRLRDITDMLQDSGLGPNAYTILELKMIEDILREEGEGRRQLFEEASGIAKYKLRRRQALAKLAQTDEDLLRLADIIAEVERQVNSLKRQVSKAKRYQELANELSLAERALAVTEYYRIVDELAPMKHALADASDRAEDSVGHLRRFEAQVEKMRLEQFESDQHLGELRKELQDAVAEISMLEAEKAGAEAKLAAARDSLERAQRQIILAKDKLSSLEARREGLTKDISDCEIALLEATHLSDESKNSFDVSQAALKDAETSYKDADSRLAALNKSQTTLENERAKHLENIARQKGRRESAIQSQDQVHAERAELEQKLAAARETLKSSEAKLRTAIHDHEQVEQGGFLVSEKLKVLESKLHELKRIEHATQSHIGLLRTLEQRGQRASLPIKLVRERIASVLLVADHAVVDARYSKAIHAALGDYAYHLVVKDTQLLQEAVGAIVQGDAGRCGFVIADLVPHHELPIVPPQAIGWAGSFVNVSECSDVIKALLEKCLIVDNFPTALKLQPFLVQHNARAVTLDGEWLDWTGSCFTGAEELDTPNDLGLAHQLEILNQTLDSALKERGLVEEEILVINGEIEAWKNRLKEFADEVSLARTLKDRENAEVLRLETLVHSLNQREEAALSLISESEEAEERLREEVSRILEVLEECRREGGSVQTEIEVLSERVWQARQENSASRDRYHEAMRALDKVRHRRELLDAESNRLTSTEKEQHESISNSSELAETGANTIRECESQLQDIARKLGELFKARDARFRAVDDAQRGKDAARGEVSAMEEQLKKLRENRELAIENQRKLEVAIAKYEGELESLASHSKSHFDLDLSQDRVPENLHELRSLEVTEEKISELRKKIENLGQVNLLSVEEFERETLRLDDMLSNRADLLQAKSTLEETIRKINETAEAKFLHTFEAVRGNFQSLFSEFFPAGEADLILSGKDLLEADITMWANPSGKRLKSLSLMSGGEKTMTAIALLFSLYQVKPSPFCVLDEVDAPLDDANIDRFTRMIRRHSDHTQFIMITHNKRTMEVTDNLYGVTMQEEGVSKLVSVRLLNPADAQTARTETVATG